MADHNFLLRQLPEGLKPLAGIIMELATDLRWTWSHGGDELWKAMAPDIWDRTENPYVVLQNLTQERLQELDNNPHFKERLQQLKATHNDYATQPSWFDETCGEAGLKGIAYFSMEFGLGEALPLYAGGLGVLAGDHLKAASDMGVPLIAIGLLYQEGYFRQVVDIRGRQQEIYNYNDSSTLPISPTQARSGAWLHIPIDLPGRQVWLRVWQVEIGRITLYLLDSNDPLNDPNDRGITGKLYGGGQEMRLMQEMALGIGGWRLIEALGKTIDVCHLNEGHAAFVTLERARCFMECNEVDFWEALWATRAGNLFTTHTPVAAGFDTFHPVLMAKYGLGYAQGLGVKPEEIVALGRKNPNDHNEPFNMAYLAVRTCLKTNGVSRLHGEVSRHIFQPLFPLWPQHEVPVGHITNGVHVPSWDSPWADEIWTRACGKGRWLGTPEDLTAAIAELDDETLWTFRGQERADLIHHVRRRHKRQLGRRGVDAEVLARADHVLDVNTLTLGFARRFTEYKRPNLLLRDTARLLRLLTNPERPVQLIVAGKSHPYDDEGKALICEWAQLSQRPEVQPHIVFIEDYDIALAQEMVQGVDVWINTPRRLNEASGTSGMKVLVNGGLNLSELDGWWDEAYSEEVGWALGGRAVSGEAHRDDMEAEQLYRILEEQVTPMFYQRDAAGIPRAWVARIRHSMSKLTPQFSTNRMVFEYFEQMYLPAANAFHARSADGGTLARELRNWERVLKNHWHEIHFGKLDVRREDDAWRLEVPIYLGEIPARFVQVQLYTDAESHELGCCELMQQGEQIVGAMNAYLYHISVNGDVDINHFTPRVIPSHPAAQVPTELRLISWQR